MKTTIKSQYDLVKSWGIATGAVCLNSLSQFIPVDNSIGTGYFERYDFENTSLSRLQCQFKKTRHFTNESCQTAYVIYFILQGSSQIVVEPLSNTEEVSPKHINLKAPSMWLLKGDLGKYSTTIKANEEIKAFFIELNEGFITTLTEQLRHKTDFYSLVLVKLITIESFFNIPKVLNVHTGSFIKQAWELFNIPSPKDEMSFMALQGQTLVFTSQLLMQPFNKLVTEENSRGFDQSKSNNAFQAKLLIDEYYQQNWTIRELAKKSGTNECYLKSQFKQLTQLTINQYRTQKRMQVAHNLLIEGNKVAQVACQTGFNSTEYFVKVFKKYYGYHPHDIPVTHKT